MIIRQEKIDDYEVVYKLIKDAFNGADYSDGTEQDLVEALRKNTEAFIPELSLVAEESGVIIGHILFSKMKVGKDIVLALAPLSVKFEYQKQGVGAMLINEGHRIAASLGFDYSIVLGSEDYYPKFGYRPATDFSIEIPMGISPQNYMAIQLRPYAKKLGGKVSYAKEFGI